MAFDRFLIAPINTGLQLDLKPWLIPDDAFQQMQNAYVFRGRVRKRFGSKYMGAGGNTATAQFLSRLRINVGVLTGGSTLTGTAPGVIFQYGQAFSVGATLYTVVQSGAMFSTVVGDTGSFNTTTGVFSISSPSNSPGTIVYFYPSTPVMGLTNYSINAINDQPSYAFDTQFVYVWTGATGWQLSGTYNSATRVLTSAIWHDPSKTRLNYVWSENWEGATANVDELFVTNFQVTNPNGASVITDDPLWEFNGTIWAPFRPYFLPKGGAVSAGPFVQTCRIIIVFHNRLILLNTIEDDNSGGGNTGVNSWYVNRARYSFRGSPLAVNAWYEPNQVDAAGNVGAGAGFIDAATDEQIVSAEFIKDRLIVYFERSTWELAYTGNELQPFVWQKINTELGSESTFGTVPFDKTVLTIGNTGVHACSGANVERIDIKIPDEIFKIQDKNSEPSRIQGIRDYETEMVYWTITPSDEDPHLTFCNKLLVYNYRNNTWSVNDDAITAFGFFEQQTDETWATSTYSWEDNDNDWTDGITEAQFREIIAGNQQGYVFICNQGIAENASVMQLTNIAGFPGPGLMNLGIIDHTLSPATPNVSGDYIYIENAVGTMGPLINGKIFEVVQLGVAPLDPSQVITIQVPGANAGLSYLGGGVVKRVSNIGIKTKQWNPYVEQGRDFFLSKIDFAVQRVGLFDPTYMGPQITVDYYPNSSAVSMLGTGSSNAVTPFAPIMGTGILELTPYDPAFYPLESAGTQQKLWHSLYFQTKGNCIELNISFSSNQITVPAIAFAPFELEAMVLHTQPTSTRLQ